MALRTWPRRYRWALACLVLIVSSEAACRLFWWVRAGVPVLAPGRFAQVFYPQLKRLPAAGMRAEDEFDVLVLAASVLHEEYGNFEETLARELARRTARVRIVNLATPGHTSRDSLLKLRFALQRAPFDLVIVYHGINELRTNNCPPEVFREDYGHYSFNRVANAFFGHRLLRVSSLAATVYYASVRLSERLGLSRTLPRGRPRQEWLAHGADLKSAVPFERNLREIVATCQQHGTPVALMSFAHYIPADYSLERFQEQALDYGSFVLPLELWGDPDHVRAGLARHNAVIASVAAETGCLFVDQHALLGKNGLTFNDVCHLTGAGTEAFVRNLLAAIDHLLP